MFTEYAVLWSATPICSAIDMNRLLKISSADGVDVGAGSHPVGQRFDAFENEVAAFLHRCLPAGFDHGCGGSVEENRGP